jgi:hypothetical protein
MSTDDTPRPSSLLIAIAGCIAIIGWLLATREAVAHWFLAPVFVCGVIIGIDAVEYLRGRLDLFDPVGILGLFGVHFFFLAPLLHVAWGSYLEPWIDQPKDWRAWLGWMAMFNAAGLCLYQGARRRAVLWGGSNPPQTMRQVVRSRMLPACLLGLVISGILQAGLYIQHGGVMSYIDAFTASARKPQEDQVGSGMGMFFIVSESFPILALMFYVLLADRKKYARSVAAVLVALLIFFVLKMFFGGLRGSRSNTIWGLFWAAGIVHLWLRPLSRKLVVFGLGFLVVFMYLYGFYKELGRNVVGYELSELEHRSNRGFEGMLLGDLGRADVQALLLQRILSEESDYRLAWGRTYVGTIALLIPRSIWPDRPPNKDKEGTDLIYGAGAYEEGRWRSSKVFGIAGEAMLNFGPWPVPLTYLLLGIIVGRLQRAFTLLRRNDARRLVYPFFIISVFTIIQSDSDNLFFNSIKDGLIPLAVVWIGSRRVRVPETEPETAPVLFSKTPLPV